MGDVYEALHADLHKVVALKVLRRELRRTPSVVERFLREAQLASRVHHRHAVEVFDLGQHEGVVYLATERLHGESLAQALEREGALDPQRAVDVLVPALAAVAEAHEGGIVHRGIKPENLFLSVDRRGQVEPRVVDFCLARALDTVAREGELTRVSALLGPHYLAPEVVRSARHASEASDQYALGAVLYRCVTGAPPFRAQSYTALCELILAGACLPPLALVPSLPEGLSSVISRAMAADPRARFPSVTALGVALLPFAGEPTRLRWAGALVEHSPCALPSSPPSEYAGPATVPFPIDPAPPAKTLPLDDTPTFDLSATEHYDPTLADPSTTTLALSSLRSTPSDAPGVSMERPREAPSEPLYDDSPGVPSPPTVRLVPAPERAGPSLALLVALVSLAALALTVTWVSLQRPRPRPSVTASAPVVSPSLPRLEPTSLGALPTPPPTTPSPLPTLTPTPPPTPSPPPPPTPPPTPTERPPSGSATRVTTTPRSPVVRPPRERPPAMERTSGGGFIIR